MYIVVKAEVQIQCTKIHMKITTFRCMCTRRQSSCDCLLARTLLKFVIFISIFRKRFWTLAFATIYTSIDALWMWVISKLWKLLCMCFNGFWWLDQNGGLHRIVCHSDDRDWKRNFRKKCRYLYFLHVVGFASFACFCNKCCLVKVILTSFNLELTNFYLLICRSDYSPWWIGLYWMQYVTN